MIIAKTLAPRLSGLPFVSIVACISRSPLWPRDDWTRVVVITVTDVELSLAFQNELFFAGAPRVTRASTLERHQVDSKLSAPPVGHALSHIPFFAGQALIQVRVSICTSA